MGGGGCGIEIENKYIIKKENKERKEKEKEGRKQGRRKGKAGGKEGRLCLYLEYVVWVFVPSIRS